MWVRILTALIGIPIAALLIFLPDERPFTAVIGIISGLGAMEFYAAMRKMGARPVEWAGLISVVLIAVSARTYEPSSIGAMFPAVITLLLIFSFLVELVRHKHVPITNVGTTIFGVVYVGWMISHLVALRQLQGPMTVGSYATEKGAVLVMLTFLATWACDTFAYFLGKYLGRRKLAPNLSPNKTWEGSIGGFMGSVIMVVSLSFVINMPIGHAIALGALFGLLSQIGDLSESAIKREIGIKDSGNIVPGHGGILDRFDSLLFSGPIAYYYVLLFLKDWPH